MEGRKHIRVGGELTEVDWYKIEGRWDITRREETILNSHVNIQAELRVKSETLQRQSMYVHSTTGEQDCVPVVACFHSCV